MRVESTRNRYARATKRVTLVMAVCCLAVSVFTFLMIPTWSNQMTSESQRFNARMDSITPSDPSDAEAVKRLNAEKENARRGEVALRSGIKAYWYALAVVPAIVGGALLLVSITTSLVSRQMRRSEEGIRRR